jgi:hypothetical protein
MYVVTYLNATPKLNVARNSLKDFDPDVDGREL